MSNERISKMVIFMSNELISKTDVLALIKTVIQHGLPEDAVYAAIEEMPAISVPGLVNRIEALLTDSKAKPDDIITKTAVFHEISNYLNRSRLGETTADTELRVGEIASILHNTPAVFDKTRLTRELMNYIENP